MANLNKVSAPVPQKPATAGKPPEWRLAQADTDKDGNMQWRSVGGIWKNDKPGGKTFASMRLGENLRLLVFENDKDVEKNGQYRLVQAITNKDGKAEFQNVGAIFLNTKEGAKSWGLVKIGELKLSAFVNTPKPKPSTQTEF